MTREKILRGGRGREKLTGLVLDLVLCARLALARGARLGPEVGDVVGAAAAEGQKVVKLDAGPLCLQEAV